MEHIVSSGYVQAPPWLHGGEPTELGQVKLLKWFTTAEMKFAFISGNFDVNSLIRFVFYIKH